ncbi:MAG: hypothetical protein HGGPFJEG_00290 [Ignavibacteria bacterium]|nr:hypothetical protein [Ignavibacteria bacterium]
MKSVNLFKAVIKSFFAFLCLLFFSVNTFSFQNKDNSVVECRNQLSLEIPNIGGNENPLHDTIRVSDIPPGNFIHKIIVDIDTVIHTWIGDLRFWLTKGNTSDTLISRIGWTGIGFGNPCDDFIGTKLTDSTGLTSIQNIPSLCIGLQSQTTGYFKPKSPLSVFNNSDPNGEYILNIGDIAGGQNLGYLKAWCIRIFYGNKTGVNDLESEEMIFSLDQNYPNPFNAATVFRFTIHKKVYTALKIFNLQGKLVTILSEGIKTPGTYEIEFNSNGLS